MPTVPPSEPFSIVHDVSALVQTSSEAVDSLMTMVQLQRVQAALHEQLVITHNKRGSDVAKLTAIIEEKEKQIEAEKEMVLRLEAMGKVLRDVIMVMSSKLESQDTVVQQRPEIQRGFREKLLDICLTGKSDSSGSNKYDWLSIIVAWAMQFEQGLTER
ncbi:hypothetical protein VNI00_014517 [Paramarasmius palmivorus]|uniref:Uncharacterized protein n=1 Tax=Paramarasmius palmivorus TaxID=297713 RepID=A0AAW0BVK0_9AGAR